MSSNASVEALGLASERSAVRRYPVAPLWAALAGVAYPFAPGLLFRLAAIPLDAALHSLALGAGIALVFLVPLAGLGLLWTSAGANDRRALVSRGIGLCLIVTPPLTALGTTLAGVARLRPVTALSIWIALWGFACIGVARRSGVARPLFPSIVNRRVRRTHRAFIVLLIAFVALHLAVNLTALHDLSTYNQAAGWFRVAWRTSAGEPILIGLLVLQLVTGIVLALDTVIGRSTFEHLCQVAAGLFVGAFLTSHTVAVAVLGRRLLDRGPDFTFASAGPGGLLSSAQGATLLPYYALGVVAVAVHLARPLRLWFLRNAGTTSARVAAATLVAAGVLISVLLVTALVSPVSR
jgi:hypothetical protein